MNCRNGERWLREALDSVFAQTYRTWEIVFWDNASTDRSAEIARSYGERVRVFSSATPLPLGAARHLALQEARGEYLALLDTDDVWLPRKTELQVAAMEASPDCALCYAGVIEIDASGTEFKRVIPRHASGDLFDVLLRQFDIHVPVAMLRRSALQRSGLSFDATVTASEEYCLFMQLAARFPICVIREPLARYRVHDGSLTNASIAKWAEEREYTLRLLEASLPGLRASHRTGFAEAYDRARYYRARYHVARGERGAALRALAPAATRHLRYAALTAVLLLPLGVWNRLHEWRLGRRRYAVA